jgi:uncharacterized membrane protein
MCLNVYPEDDMVSTVITTTVVAASVAVAAVVGLVLLLVARELIGTSESPDTRLGLLSRHLVAFAAPLLIVFAFIVVMAVLEVVA